MTKKKKNKNIEEKYNPKIDVPDSPENKDFSEETKDEHIVSLIEQTIYSKYTPGKQKSMLYKLLFMLIKILYRIPEFNNAISDKESKEIQKYKTVFLDMKKTIEKGKKGEL